ncbi:hypothetical protein GGF31_000115 [Allomyces arbusculus]|nr:hypothetical protein GGF31_000115 [Allomyces arbusculus]
MVHRHSNAHLHHHHVQPHADTVPDHAKPPGSTPSTRPTKSPRKRRASRVTPPRRPYRAHAPLTVTLAPDLTAYVASYHDPGRRAEQQDETLVAAVDDLQAVVIGVLDGHGPDGGRVARFARDLLAEIVPQCLREVVATSSVSDADAALDELIVQVALQTAFARVARAVLENDELDCYISGTTAVVAVVTADACYVANVGDSRAAIAQKPASALSVAELPPEQNGEKKLPEKEAVEKWIGVRLTRDHTCDDPDELERVQAAGARVDRLAPNEDDSPLRIFKGTLPYPGIVVTRSIGDSVAKKLGVVADPEFTHHRIDPSRDVAVLVASDGVWDGLPHDHEAVRHVAAAVRPARGTTDRDVWTAAAESASRKVLRAALRGLDRREIDDNVSNVCVLLVRHAPPLPPRPASVVPTEASTAVTEGSAEMMAPIEES